MRECTGLSGLSHVSTVVPKSVMMSTNHHHDEVSSLDFVGCWYVHVLAVQLMEIPI